MLQNQNASQSDADEADIRDIHALTPPPPPPPPPPPATQQPGGARRTHSWEGNSHRSPTLSEVLGSENFSSMSREFNAMVVAGSAMQNDNNDGSNLARIGEEEVEETNPLAIVPDNNPMAPLPPVASPRRAVAEEVSVQRVKKEEVESKISAWQTAEVAKLNNRFKRQDVIINSWEQEQVDKAASWLKKIERKLDEQRARALEKMQNDVAKARRKAEEKRASAEAKRGMKVAKVLEVANVMRAVGRAPSKRSFF